jgi:hypothetical protein
MAAAFMVTRGLAGYELTDAGATLQLPLPPVTEHVRATALLNPSCDVTLIVPLVVVLPAFTTGNAAGSLRMKVGLSVTFSANEVVTGAAPLVLACRVTV